MIFPILGPGGTLISGNNNQVTSLLNIFAQLFVTLNVLSDLQNDLSSATNNSAGNGGCGCGTAAYSIPANNLNEICFQVPGGKCKRIISAIVLCNVTFYF